MTTCGEASTECAGSTCEIEGVCIHHHVSRPEWKEGQVGGTLQRRHPRHSAEPARVCGRSLLARERAVCRFAKTWNTTFAFLRGTTTPEPYVEPAWARVASHEQIGSKVNT
jgi:hypothetical protein